MQFHACLQLKAKIVAKQSSKAYNESQNFCFDFDCNLIKYIQIYIQSRPLTFVANTFCLFIFVRFRLKSGTPQELHSPPAQCLRTSPVELLGQPAVADMIDQNLKIIADKRANHGDKQLLVNNNGVYPVPNTKAMGYIDIEGLENCEKSILTILC